MDYDFVVVSKSLLPNPRSPRFSPLFYSRSFMVLCYTFRSMIHVESLMSAYRIFSFSLYMDIQLFQTICWKLSLPHWVAFAPLPKISWLQLCGSVTGAFYSALPILLVCSFASTTALSGLLWLHCRSWHLVVSVLWLCYSLSILCCLFWVFCLPI